MQRSKKLKLPLALFLIALSILVCSGGPYFLWRYTKQCRQNDKINPTYHISTLVQKGPVKEALKTIHLCELLDLSVDQPQNLVAFDLQRGKELLLSSGVIASADLIKSPPNTLEIDYTVREPIAFLADYSNTVIDKEGYIFPLKPYFTPKILPKFYLGIQIEPFVYGRIKSEKIQIALDVYYQITKYNRNKLLFVEQIDVSSIEASSLGQQEIVVTFYETIADQTYIRYLRLSRDNYEEEYRHFLDLKAMTMPKNLVVDLRMLPNAYLTPLTLQ